MCLLHSYAHPEHERDVARRLRGALPGVHVVASVDVAPEFREYERASTAVADAYLGPVAGRYLRHLGRSAAERGLPEPDVMQSSGGVCGLEDAAAHPVRLLLSGPAGGVAAVSALGTREAVSFDMGGTSTDVCLIRDGEAGISSQRAIAGLPVRVPHVDIHTVGAGGGSIAWLDEGGALRVGPQSAGRRSGAGGLRPRWAPADRDRRQRRARAARPDGSASRAACASTPGPRGRRCGRSRARSGRCGRPRRA